MFQSILVYKFKCKISYDIYDGKNKRHFKFWAPGHLAITFLIGKKVKSQSESVGIDYIVHTDHNARFDDFETLVKEYDEFRLLLRSIV